MKYSRRLFAGFLSGISALFLILFFQNCGQSFKVSELASEVIEPLSTPSISFKTPPPVLSNLNSFDVEISITSDRRTTMQSVTCQIDSLPPKDCASGKLPLSGLTDGDHTIRINATDARGQRTDELVALFRVDTIAPTVSLTEKPAAVTGSVAAKFSIVATDALSDIVAVECALDAAAYANCQTMASHMVTVAAGTRSIKIRAKDKAGNVSTEVLFSWLVDLTAPTISIVKPNNFVNSKSISIAFSGVDDGKPITDFECQLDGAGFASCASPKAYNATLTEGVRVFEVRGRDTAGNLSAPQAVSFTVDTVAPSIPVVTTALSSPTKVTTPQIAFTSTDVTSGVAGYSCAVDNGTFVNCSSPFTFSVLTDGVKSLKVKSRDNAGNESVAGSLPLTIDTTVPTILISSTQSPAAQTTEKMAVFGFSASDAGSGLKFIECQLDQGAFAACTSPVTFNVAVGSHTLVVRVTDNATNMASDSRTWNVIDAPPAVLTWTVPPITFITGSVTTFDLATTLPSGAIKNGVFSVDPAGMPLPSGMILNPTGTLMLGTATAGIDGVQFAYTEP